MCALLCECSRLSLICLGDRTFPFGQIQTPKQLYEWAKEALLSTTFEYVDKTEVQTEEDLLRERLESSITIEGTHSYHAYYPLDGSTTKLRVKEYSNSLFSEVVNVSDHRDPFPIPHFHSYPPPQCMLYLCKGSKDTIKVFCKGPETCMEGGQGTFTCT